MAKTNKLSILLNGIIKENPVLVLVLGTCPTLATTTSVISAFSMGLANKIMIHLMVKKILSGLFWMKKIDN